MKDKRIYCRLDDDLKLFLENVSKELDCTISSYIRNRIYSPEYVYVHLEYNRDFETVLTQMGNNINQIARKLNVLLKTFNETDELKNNTDGLIVLLKSIQSSLDENKNLYEEFMQTKKEANKELLKIIKEKRVFNFLLETNEESSADEGEL